MKNKIVHLLGTLFIIVSMFYLFRKIMSMGIDFKLLFMQKNLIYFFVCILIYTILQLVLYYPWGVFVQDFGEKKIEKSLLRFIYCKANIYKYLPGNVFQYIGRNEIALLTKIHHDKVVLATIAEMVLLIVSAFSVSFLFSSQYALEWILEKKVLFLIVFVLLLVGTILLFLLRKKVLVFIKKYIVFFLSRDRKKSFFLFIIFYIGFFVLNGTMLFVGLSLLGNENLNPYYFTIVGLYTLSWVAGYITPGVPGGIGIREAMISILLSSIMAQEVVISIVILMRFINIIGDILSFFIAWIFHTVKKRKQVLQ